MINYILTLQSQLQEALERAEKLRAAMKRALEAAIGAKS